MSEVVPIFGQFVTVFKLQFALSDQFPVSVCLSSMPRPVSSLYGLSAVVPCLCSLICIVPSISNTPQNRPCQKKRRSARSYVIIRDGTPNSPLGSITSFEVVAQEVRMPRTTSNEARRIFLLKIMSLILVLKFGAVPDKSARACARFCAVLYVVCLSLAVPLRIFTA